ncbi:hypothetical protein D3C81_1503990 [compost metagenome]
MRVRTHLKIGKFFKVANFIRQCIYGERLTTFYTNKKKAMIIEFLLMPSTPIVNHRYPKVCYVVDPGLKNYVRHRHKSILIMTFSGRHTQWWMTQT